MATIAWLGPWLRRHDTKLLAASPLIGLLWQDLAGVLRSAVPVLAAVSILLSCVRMDWGMLGSHLRRPARAALSVAWILIAMPLVMFVIAVPWLPIGSPLLTGLVLNAAAPSIMAAPAFALIIGIEPTLAMVVSVASTALAPVTVPAAMGILELGALDIPASNLLVRLLLFVTFVVLGAWTVKRLAGQAKITRHGTLFEAAFVTAMCGLIIGIMDGVTAVLLTDPLKMALYVFLAFCANLGMQIAGGLAAWWRDRQFGLVLALLSGNRNMAMILAVIIDVADRDLVLFVICCQFPCYVLPLFMRPLIRRLRS